MLDAGTALETEGRGRNQSMRVLLGACHPGVASAGPPDIHNEKVDSPPLRIKPLGRLRQRFASMSIAPSRI